MPARKSNAYSEDIFYTFRNQQQQQDLSLKERKAEYFTVLKMEIRCSKHFFIIFYTEAIQMLEGFFPPQQFAGGLVQLAPILNNYKDHNFRINKTFETGAMHTKGIANFDLLLTHSLIKSAKDLSLHKSKVYC